MRIHTFALSCFLTLAAMPAWAQGDRVTLDKSPQGFKLMVDGKPMMVNGMNYDHYPIGETFNYQFWKQPDDVIIKALDTEMPLLKNMGVNAIRQYNDIGPRWVKYIYEKYGIYTMINCTFGRYGLNYDGAWHPNTDYSLEPVKKALMKEATDMVKTYEGTPGLLFYLLGNENCYGLFWQGAETEDIPVEDRKSTKQAKYLYALFNEAAVEMKKIGAKHPVGLCNGDLLFLDVIAKECPDVDLLAINCYRGPSFGDLFERVKKETGKPVIFSEFGSDAFNARTKKEAQKEQADILVSNWKEIYQNAAGLGLAGNSLGGFTFQWADGWWKNGQTVNLDVHDTNASWANAGYQFDYEKGENNMNEEWFGICAKGQPDAQGIFDVYPRAAYYALKDIHKINPYAAGMTASAIASQVARTNVTASVLAARGDKAALEGEKSKLVRISELRGDFTTYYTGASHTTTPSSRPEKPTSYPAYKGFDHMESFYLGVASQPVENLNAEVTVNFLGHVAENPIDEIFYENRGRSRYITDEEGNPIDIGSLERFRVYNASVDWEGKYFKLNAFFRKGHYHWGYEGDFFGFYPEANYGANMDIYGGDAPLGAEVAGKRKLDGLKVAFGPELWWGANPAVLAKYYRKVGKVNMGTVFQYDIAKRTGTTTSYAIPLPKNTRLGVMLNRKFGPVDLTLGGLWSGNPLVGRTFQATKSDAADAPAYLDKVKHSDTFGGKLKLVYYGGRFNFYTQGAILGLVASGGADQTQTLTGWKLKDVGTGNLQNVLAGFTVNMGNFQIAPNFLWQKPLVGPMPNGIGAPARLRNVLDDPFAVRSNREMTAGELLLSFDPTPATQMWDWDADNKEDAPFAIAAGFIYRHLPTSMDAAVGVLADGRSTFVFGGSAPAHDLWETNLKITSRISPTLGLIISGYYGTAQGNGDDGRLIHRAGANLDMLCNKLRIIADVKANDWGPYDYHRDFNLTYPFQGVIDLSTNLKLPKWIGTPTTRIGLRGTYRTLDKYSPRYVAATQPDGLGGTTILTDVPGAKNGNEWEIRTYISFSLF